MNPTFDEIAARWRSEGFGCVPHIDAPFQQWRDLCDPRDEKVRVQSGEIELEIEGTISRLGAGQEVLIPAHALHSSRAGASGASLLFGYREMPNFELCAKQKADFERDGFLVLPQIVPLEDLALIVAETRALSATLAPEVGMRTWHERALFRRSAFRRFFEWRALLQAELELLGEDAQLLALDVLLTRPQNGGVGWHRDVTFVCDTTLSINTAIYLQDMTPETGFFRVVPGSHRHSRDLGQNPENAVEIPARLGDAVLFDAGLWHAGNRNNSPHDRAGLFAYFGKFWIKRMDAHFTQPLPQALLQSRDPLTRQLLGLELRAGVLSYHGDDPSYNLRGEEGLDF